MIMTSLNFFVNLSDLLADGQKTSIHQILSAHGQKVT